MSNHAKPQTFAPLFLRLALGATFIWAGAGKLMPQDYSGPMAETIASMNEGTILQGQWPPPTAAPESEAPAAPESGADASAGDEPDPDSSAESIDDEPGAEAEAVHAGDGGHLEIEQEPPEVPVVAGPPGVHDRR